jgi:hypothetical protein
MPVSLSGSLLITGSLTVTEGIIMSGSIASASYAVSSSNAFLATNVVGTANRILFNSATNTTTTSNNLTWENSINLMALGDTTGTAGTISKIALYTSSFGGYGLGVSPAQLDYVSDGSHVFYKNGVTPTELVRIANNGDVNISSSLNVTNGITGNLTGTASYATNANLLDGLDSTVFTSTASFTAQTASFTAFTSSLNTFSASILSYTSSINAKTSSFATTSSNTFIGTQTITGSLLQSGNYTTTGTITSQTINVQQVTSSIVYSCGSNNFGTAIGNTQVFTGSMFITGSNIVANVGNACFGGSVCSPSFVGGTVCGTNATFIGQVLVNTDTATNGQLVVSSVGFDDTILRVEQRRSGYASALNLIGVNDAGAAYNYIASGTNSGVVHWRVGGNGTTCTLVLSTAGSERLTISSTGVAYFSNTVCAPAAIFSGCVGIGTTSPSSILHLAGPTGAGSSTQLIFDRLGGYGAYYVNYAYESTYYANGSTLEFRAGNALTQIRLTSNNPYTAGNVQLMPNGGNVGIGTTSPSYALEVCSNVADWASRIQNSNGAGNGLLVRTNNTCTNTTAFGVYNGTQYTMAVLGSGVTNFACQVCAPQICSTYIGASCFLEGPLKVGIRGCYITAPAAIPYIYYSERFPDNASGAFPFNQYGELIFQAGNRAGYNAGFSFATGTAEVGCTATVSVKARIFESGAACFACQVCIPRLHINTPDGCGLTLQYGTNSGYAGISTDSANSLIFKAYIGTEYMRIACGGCIGMNQTSPETTLDIGNYANQAAWSSTTSCDANLGENFENNIIIQAQHAAVANDAYGYPTSNLVFRTSNASNAIWNVGAIQGVVDPFGGSYYQGGLVFLTRPASNDCNPIGRKTQGGPLVPILSLGQNSCNCRIAFFNSNVGIGTASPSQKLEVVGGEIKAGRVDSSSEGGQISFGRASDNATGYYIDAFGSTSTPVLRFVDVSNSAVRMTLSNQGSLWINSTTASPTFNSYIYQYNGDGSRINAMFEVSVATTGFTSLAFRNPNGVVGSVAINENTVTYSGTSDYRLKEDLRDFDGLNKVAAIKVYDFKWKTSEERNEGVLAHELESIVPYAVTGEKDAVFEDGSIKSQMVDYSKLVPVLIKAIQEQQCTICSQASTINTLKTCLGIN